MIGVVLREPLFWFLSLAGGLYLANSMVTVPEQSTDPYEIIVSRDDLLTFMQFRAKAFDRDIFSDRLDELSKEDIQRLISDYAREEALYREAKALRLDENDYLAKRRLIQQFEFLTQDYIAKTDELSEPELQSYYKQNSNRYYEPETITFTHVFVSHDRDNAETQASKILIELNEQGASYSSSSVGGDRFLYHRNYVRKNKEEIQSHFDKAFTNSIFSLQSNFNEWKGPIRSKYGWHLVLVTEKTASRMPPLEEIRARVARDATQAKSDKNQEAAIKAVVDSYDVSILQPIQTGDKR